MGLVAIQSSSDIDPQGDVRGQMIDWCRGCRTYQSLEGWPGNRAALSDTSAGCAVTRGKGRSPDRRTYPRRWWLNCNLLDVRLPNHMLGRSTCRCARYGRALPNRKLSPEIWQVERRAPIAVTVSITNRSIKIGIGFPTDRSAIAKQSPLLW